MPARFSRKRQSILDCFKNTSEHPSAEWVYEKLKPLYPDLSLGTVYRNISRLLKEGKIVSVGTVLNKERYDAKVSPHTHAVCKKCGKIADLFEVKLPEETVLRAQNISDFKFDYSQIQFVGICRNCRDKNA